MKFPRTVRFRHAKVKIYGRTQAYRFYRVAAYVAGKRRMVHLATFSEAKECAERWAREIARGSDAAALTSDQARDALAALQTLAEFHGDTGRRVSLLAAVNTYCATSKQLNGMPLAEAVSGYLSTVASVQHKDIAEAVEEFIRAEQPRTQAGEGQRAQLSVRYAYQRNLLLRRFSGTFLNMAVCDLTKAHLDAFIGSLGSFSPKTRNHHREAVHRFLGWAVRKDYLPPPHRLFEAESMRPEHANLAVIECCRPNEFRALLEASEGSMRALIALGGLAGLRTAELTRLDWADVWRAPGYIEVTAGKAKTRQRRLVEICPALAAWLEPYRSYTTGKLWTMYDNTFQIHLSLLCKRVGVTRKPNGLRHAFCTFHFALHGNENLTAMHAGNSPAMIHRHYKGRRPEPRRSNGLPWPRSAPCQTSSRCRHRRATKGKDRQGGVDSGNVNDTL